MNTVQRRILFFHIERRQFMGQKGHHIKGITCGEYSEPMAKS